MAAHTAALDEYGPERSRTCTPAEAVAWCHRLTLRRQENFSVLSALVPPALVADFSAFTRPGEYRLGSGTLK